MEIIRAQESDMDGIEMIYGKIHTEEEKGLTTNGWIRHVYPVREA